MTRIEKASLSGVQTFAPVARVQPLRTGMTMLGSEAAIREGVIVALARRLGIDPGAIDPNVRFKALGLDSAGATALIAELAALLDRTLAPTLAWEFPTPNELASHLAGRARAARADLDDGATPSEEPVAIVGLACRFPGAPDKAAFWELLTEGRDAIRQVPEGRWDASALFDPDPAAPGKMSTRWGGFLDDVGSFDAGFFGISPREAAQIDPQQRLMLELSWEALEDARTRPGALGDSRTGVFFGAMFVDYAALGSADQIVTHTATGRDASIVPARVAYTLGLRGPAILVNTACSSSLVAIELARRSVLRGESRTALAGGVNLILSPESTIAMTKFGAMAPDGRSKAFDARANGYVRGEGGGVVVLKRLADAIRDGDRIYCVIRGGAINNDGFSNGLTAPSPQAQEDVLRAALADAAVRPEEVDYVEAHGTGTMLGDPIEANALGAVLGRDRTEPLRIGSVKTNIGHLEAAAGVAGLIKVALAIHHHELPRSLHFETPNPLIDFSGLGLRVQAERVRWTPEGGRYVAGVSSFGFGGTNCHLLVASPPHAPEERPPATSPAARVGWLFTGQGAQRLGMGRELYASDRRFRRAFDEALAAIDSWLELERPLRDVIWGEDAALLEQTAYAQPALFAFEWALAAVVGRSGAPLAVLGHSVGEIAAAAVAGVFGLDDAAKLVVARGRLMDALPTRGGMLSIAAPEAKVIGAIAGTGLAIAAVNGPSSIVVAGDRAELDRLEETLGRQGVASSRLRVANAFHSAFVDPMLDALRDVARTLDYRAPAIPVLPGIGASAGPPPVHSPEYWVRQVREAVRFAEGVRALTDLGVERFVEIGPSATLARLVDAPVAALDGAREAASFRGIPEVELASPHQPDSPPDVVSPHRPALVVVSAATSAAADSAARRLRAHLERDPDLALDDVAFSLATTRDAHRYRRAYVATSREGLLEALGSRAADGGAVGGAAAEGETPRTARGSVAFVFAGQGSHAPAMGALADSWPEFAAALTRVERALAPHLRVPLRDVLEDPRLLARTELAQPALFAHGYALAFLLRSLGIEPDVLVGHSVGEITAATVAGILSVGDAARLVATRGRLMQAIEAPGAMVAIAAPSVEIEAIRDALGFAEVVAIAARNGPRSVVISGAREAVGAVAARCRDRGLAAKELDVERAFHSPLLDPMLDDLRAVARTLRFAEPRLPIIAAASPRAGGAAITDPEYWVRQARDTVDFAGAARSLDAAGARTFVEIAPRPTLLAAVQECLPDRELTLISSARGVPEALARWYVEGRAIRWERLHAPDARRVDLPTYPWQRTRHWLPARLERADLRGSATGHPLLGDQLAIAGAEAVYAQELSIESASWLADHRVGGRVVVPAAALLEMVREAATRTLGDAAAGIEILGLAIEAPLALPDAGVALAIQLTITREDDRLAVAIHSRAKNQSDRPWTLHARCHVAALASAIEPEEHEDEAAALDFTPDALYATFARQGLDYGPTFRVLARLTAGSSEARAELRAPEPLANPSEIARVAAIDGAFQAAIASAGAGDELVLPFAFDRVCFVAGAISPATRVAIRLRSRGAAFVADLRLLAADGRVLVAIAGLHGRRALPAVDRSTHRVVWSERPVVAVAPRRSAERWLVGGSPALASEIVATLGEEGISAERGTLDALSDVSGAEHVVLAVAPTTGDLVARTQVALDEALAVVQAMARRSSGGRLTLVTRRGQPVGGCREGEDVQVDPAAAAVWGFARSAALEHPDLEIRLVDVDDVDRALGRELVERDDDAREVGIRRGVRFVPRVVPVAPRGAGDNVALASGTRGALDTLGLVPTSRRAPGPNEVEIEVRAAGLNFRDVLGALGIYPGDPGPIGGECSGVVTRVGRDVERIAEGDAVMALAKGSAARYVTVDARQVAPIPAGLSFEQGATIPLVFLTAWYALAELGQVAPGERVLVHAVTGGVGRAAVQVARALGAKVVGTASPGKWETARSLGIEAVASSRDRSFVDALGGTPIDVVLDALTGDLVDAGLGLLREGGRFLEMGKADVRDPAAVRAAHPGVRYQAFDLFALPASVIGRLLVEVSARFASGVFSALPVERFRIEDAETAFRRMSQAKHTGKIALAVEGPGRGLGERTGTILVTGGLGALGQQVARWLARRGAAHLLLVGRSVAKAPVSELLEELRAAGTEVTVASVDVADREAVARLLGTIPPDRPLRGIVHAAGVLEDGVILEQTPQRIARVLAAKAAGAAHLDALTRGLSLEFFVLFSSVTSVVGSPGQSGYAAANAFLDALALARRAAGHAALSVSWGPWAGGGMAAGIETDAVVRGRWERRGIGFLRARDAGSFFDAMMTAPEAHLVVAPLSTSPPPPRASVTARRSAELPAGGSAIADPPDLRRREALLALVRGEVARVLSLAGPDVIGPEDPLADAGLDSLTAVELRNALGRRVGRTLPATLAFDFPTPVAIADHLFTTLAPIEAIPTAPARAVTAVASTAAEPIAIVGMGCRFPGGVVDPAGLWRLLDAGVDAVEEVPPERWDADAWYDPDPDAPGKMVTRWGGFVGGLDRFDPGFFGIAPDEARFIDPQQRLLLETTWEAIEDAGLDGRGLFGSPTGVYVGIWSSEYQARAMVDPQRLDPYSLLGTAHSTTAGRVSYWLGLRGPNMPIDTACSSGLVAVHLACQALLGGECTLALAGGVNVVLDPRGTVYFSRLRAMSPTGRCRTFSAEADGYVRSDGAGVVVLERLSDALRNGHRVLATIRGSAINQDGRSNGLTAPNGPAQEAVLRAALARAGLPGRAIGYLECHGTGTPLGDPIEVNAAARVFGEDRPANAPLVLGSIKSNLGHSEGAAGIAGLIKAVLALRHERIPRTIHTGVPNPHIPWSELAVEVAARPVPWPRAAEPRRAGVSSFGFSGTNAHVIVEESPLTAAAPESAVVSADETPALVVLSAKSPESLDGAVARLGAHLAGAAAAPPMLADVAFSLATTRTHHEHRLAIVATSLADLRAKLAAGEGLRGRARPERPRTAWLFSGQGAQVAGMGRALARVSPAFREAFDAAVAALDPLLEAPLGDVWDDPGRLGRTGFTQPALFAFEVALAAHWRAAGHVPDFVTGHSVGEIAAAHVAGILSLDDAARLVAARGRAMDALPAGGAMVAIDAPEAEVTERIAHAGATSVGLAAVNAPASVVIAGDEAEVLAIAEGFASAGISVRRLAVSHAFHSSRMDPMLDRLGEVAATIRVNAPRIPLVGLVDGALAPDLGSPDYWLIHARRAVRFADGVRTLAAEGVRRYLELGPKVTLLPYVARALPDEADLELLPSIDRAGEIPTILETLGRLHVAGEPVDLGAMCSGGRRVDLPRYAFVRERHWLDRPAGGSAPAVATERRDDLLGAPVAPDIFEPVLAVSEHPWLADHRVGGKIVVAASVLLELARAAAERTSSGGIVVLADAVFAQPLEIDDDVAHLRVSVTVNGDKEQIVIARREASAPAIATFEAVRSPGAEPPIDGARALEPGDPTQSVSSVYAALRAAGIEHGPAFAGLTRLTTRPGGEVTARIALPEAVAAGGSAIHPALVDAAFHAVVGVAPVPGLPFSVGRAVFRRGLSGREAAVQLRLRESLPQAVIVDVLVVDPADGRVAVELHELELRRPARSLAEGLAQVGWLPVHRGGGGAATNARWCILAPESDPLAEAVAGDLEARGAVVRRSLEAGEADHVVCLWPAEPGSPAAIASDGLAVAQRLIAVPGAPRLVWGTTQAVVASPSDVPSIAGAALWGLGRTLREEHPELRLLLVDWPAAAATGVAGVAALVDALVEPPATSGEIALRGGQVLAPALEPIDLPPGGWPDSLASGTVLVSGGLGALGQEVARWLAEAGAAHLVLTGRRDPARPEVADTIAALEGRGTRVTAVASDLSDATAVTALLAAIPAELPLVGVVHAAGIVDDGVLTAQSEERLRRVFAPKVDGAVHLDVATRALPLSFFVVFSSIAGTLGSAGQAPYAAANAAADAIVAARRAAGCVGTSIAWGPWSDAAGGMAARLDAASQARLAARGLLPIAPATGRALLERIVGGAAPANVVAAPLDLQALGKLEAEAVPSVLQHLVPRSPPPPPATAAPLEWLDRVRAEVARILARPIAEVPADRPLRELGFDSLMAVTLRNALARQAGVGLPAGIVFDHPTAQALAEHLRKRLAPAAAAPGSEPGESDATSRAGASDEPIAIVGIGCRYPGGVVDPESFWQVLDRGIDAISEVPRERWDIDALYDPNPDAPGKMMTRSGGFLAAIDRFDASFFGIAPREANRLDPQQRLLLETSWEALERAGIVPGAGRAGTNTGVFVGLMYQEYATLDGAPLDKLDGHVAIGSAGSVASGRISYALGLDGPSMTIDTACSSSLVTVHLACQALRQGECTTALAGGVTLMLTPTVFVEFSRLRGLSPDGRCKTFSAAADGVAWAEGCGMLVLERLSDALRNNRRILGVLRGSAVNQDGRSNGLTAPNGPAQERVIRRALAQAGVRPAEIGYVECHGTGTPLGDPIEAHALGAVLSEGRPPDRPVVVGSVKSNLGHTQAAAGVAGIIKTLLAFEHERIPRNLHVDAPSPRIAWDELPLAIATAPVPWPRGAGRRVAGVSSFGVSGTNAHVVLEEPPLPRSTEAEEKKEVARAELIVLSAKTEAALRDVVRAVHRLLGERGEGTGFSLGDLAFGLATTRKHHEHRLALAASSCDELEAALAAILASDEPCGSPASTLATKPVFVFPGQGGQWAGMGRELRASEPVFRDAFDRCERAILRETGWSLAAELDGENLDRIEIVQPALFATAVALAALFQSWGIEPAAVFGQSQGEIAAAHVAGILSLEDAVAIVCRRSDLLRSLAGRGAMALVQLSLEDAEAAIAGREDRVGIAVASSPRSTVLSGDPDAIEAIVGLLTGRGVYAKRINVDYASHSPEVDPLRAPLLEALDRITPAPATCPMRSTVTGALVTGPELDAGYWFANLRQPVRLAAVAADLTAAGHGLFLEVSPHPVLVPALEEIRTERGVPGGVTGALRRDAPERRALLEAVGALFTAGLEVPFERLFAGRRAPGVALPTYPWQRERYWIEGLTSTAGVRARRDDTWHRIDWVDTRVPAIARAASAPWHVLGDGEALAALASAGAACRSIDLGELASLGPNDPIVWSSAERDPLAASLAALELVQALARRTDAPRLFWVTRGAVTTGPDDTGSGDLVGAAAAAGLVRTLLAEHPEVRAVHLDLDPTADLAAALATEAAATDGETWVAYRGKSRRAARLVPATEQAPAREARTEGAVLVSGGLGGLGLAVARSIAVRGYREIVLLGRRGLETPGAPEAVAELEALGARVQVVAADVADPAAVRAIRTELPLRGVVHAAGVLDDGLLADQTAERFARVLAPKVRGAENLERRTAGEDLDFFVLFSSAAATLGSAAQAPYVVANAALDAIAHARRARGLVATSLAWGPWSERGMVHALDARSQARLARQGLRMITGSEGMALFEEGLRRPEAHLLVAPLDLHAAREAFGEVVPPLWRALLSASPARPAEVSARASAWADELRGERVGARLERIVQTIRADVARATGLASADDVSRDRPLRELGLDSLMALELRNRLARRAGVTLPATLVFDHPTVERIARYLLDDVLHLGEPSGGSARPANVTNVASVTPGAWAEPIAIVGLGCRYPGGIHDPRSFWRLLEDGVDAVGEVPKDRWDADAWYDPNPAAPGKMTSRWGAFLEGLEDFDPGFFGISPREAANVDPQERLLLEVAWEALERAGLTAGELMGSDTGVYMGLIASDYQTRAFRQPDATDAYALLGTAHSTIVGRLSYWLGLKGPNMPVDTACSSSLVAIHLACQALLGGECSLALAGGANVILEPAASVYLSRIRALSPTGRCRTFSADADGYVRAEGAGVVVLERLSDAVRRGHPILGLVRGSAINQDGRSNGLTAPHGPSQEAVIRAALARAGLAPASIDYLECHGTGTPLGDPIEVQAAAKVLGEGRAPGAPLVLGALKSNLGHTEAAAGVGGVIKALLAFDHESIPKTLHFAAPNPLIDWDALPVTVAGEPVPWPRRAGEPRRAGVSSFGFSGTNAHLVLEEPPAIEPSSPPSPAVEDALPLPILLSARSPEALERVAARLHAELAGAPDASLPEIAASLAHHRTHHEHRLTLVARGVSELSADLASLAGSVALRASRVREDAGRLGFLFAGQGAQVPGMGAALAARSPAFRAALEECADVLAPHLEGVRIDEVMGSTARPERLQETRFTQPALFAFEVALAAHWRSWGVTPDVVLGHSAGEIAAAHVAGILSLEDAARLVAARGRLMQLRMTPGGVMIAVAAAETDVAELLERVGDRAAVAIAAVNGPAATVIAGAEAATEALGDALRARGIRTKRLDVAYAFHSPLVEPALAELAVVAAGLRFHPPAIPLVGLVDGRIVGDEIADPAYWIAHAREAVRFADGVRTMHAAGVRRFVEIGPRSVLAALVPDCLGDEVEVVSSISRARSEGELEGLLAAAGRLHAGGAAIAWNRIVGERAHKSRPIDLPSYPWERERHWIEPEPAITIGLPPAPVLRGATGPLPPPPIVPWKDQLAGLDAAGRIAVVLHRLRQEVARILALDSFSRVPPDRPVAELGFDSLMALELRNVLSPLVPLAGRRLRAAMVLEHPTPIGLARALVALIGETTPPAGGPAAALATEHLGPTDAFVLAPNQERLWFLEHVLEGVPAYHVHVMVRIAGDLDAVLLERCFLAIARRHAPLRRVFPSRAGRPEARATDAIVPLDVHDLRESASWLKDEIERDLARSHRTGRFDLEHGPLWRVLLVTRDDEDHVLYLTQHHIITDGLSVASFLRELAALYHARGDAAVLPTLATSYDEHARRLKESRAARIAEGLEWWQAELAGLPRLSLPTRPLARSPRYLGDACPVMLSASLARRLKELVRREGRTLFEGLFAVFAILMQRWSGQDDFPVATLTSGRDDADLQNLLGFFVETAILRCDLSARPSFVELLHRLHRRVVGVLEHADVPFDAIVAASSGGAERGVDLVPLAPVYFHLAPASPADLGVPGMAWQWVPTDRADGGVEGTTKFNLGLTLIDGPSGIRGSFEFATDLFDRRTVQAMVRHFEVLLGAVVSAPDAPIAIHDVLTAEERASLVARPGPTEGDALPLVPTRLASSVRERPEAVAVVSGSERIDYAELDRRSSRLATALRRRGVRPNALVAVALERSVAMVVALAAVTKAGGAYVPLDPTYPPDRLAYMLADSGASVLLTNRGIVPALEDQVPHVVLVDEPPDDGNDGDRTFEALEPRPDHLAYVIYTSGSTGRPKGVEIEHGALANLLRHFEDELAFTSADHLLAVTSLSFDIAGLELWLPLVTGAAVEVLPRDEASDAAALARALGRATVFQATPATWQLLLSAGWRGERRLRALCGGEAMPPELGRAIAERTAVLFNVYGPTETTIWSTTWRVDPSRSQPCLGKPLRNTRAYVLDKEGKPVPAGVLGEIHLAGDGLARGYHGRPDLTEERFVPDPFAGGGARMYRTGDLGRWASDGNLEYAGRADDQVKVRGFRIELGEIEACLSAEPRVLAAAVVVSDPGLPSARIDAAVVVREADRGAIEAALRPRLAASLPEHMIPGTIALLDAFPLLPNGKVDRKTIAAAIAKARQATPEGHSVAVPPLGGGTEEALAAIWQTLLGGVPIDRRRTFFEHGGTSLQLVQVQQAIEARCGVAISVAELFRYPSLESLAARIDAGRGAVIAPAPPASVAEPEPLSDRIDALSDAEVADALRRSLEDLDDRGEDRS